MKWKYDKQLKQWYVPETVAYSQDRFTIDKDFGFYSLRFNYKFIGSFKKLSSAKEVARLIREG